MKPTSETRKPYTGTTRSLVVAFDVGTTFSGVSYAILEPGEVPKIHGVTRFPGQEHVAGNSKIPTIMYYDSEGRTMAAGAEADTPSMLSLAEDEGWIKVELFKLRLRPRTMKLNMNGMRLNPLPHRKTAVEVFGDFLSYLFLCTRNFIRDTHANGASLWRAVEHDIQFVLSHPNGWEGAQQTKMRRAAVYGGLIPDTNEGKARIRFVTEGEASLHACILNGLADDVLASSKSGFLVLDAGGGTLDLSSYTIRAPSPLVIEEVAPPDCVFAGSVFVSRRARELFQEKLKNSKYGTPDALDHITKRFDETTKRLFRDKRDAQYLPFGSPLDKDPSVGIRSGQLRLSGAEVAELFEPSIRAAVNGIKTQVDSSAGKIKSVFLVGGYANSAWLFSQLQERLEPYRIAVSRPDTQTSKAVADGAIGFYCDHHVSARMSKFMYGVEYLRQYDSADPEHVERKDRLCELPSGPRLLPDAFDCILARSVKVKESTVFTRKYCTELTSLTLLSVFEVEIWCYRGGNTIPKWIMRQADDFSTLCLVRADLSPLSSSAEAKTGKHGRVYWNIVFSVEIHFGLTEFKARIKWVDNGVTKYGPASIVYNERGHRLDEDEPDEFPEDDMTPAQSRVAKSIPGSRARSVDSTAFNTPLASTSASKRSSVLGPNRNEPPPVSNGIPEVVPPATSAPSVRTASIRSTSRVASVPRTPTAESVTISRDPSRGRTNYKGKERSAPTTSADESSGTASNRTSRLADTLSSVWGAVSPTAKSIADSLKSKEQSKEATPLSSPVKRELRDIFQSPPAPPADPMTGVVEEIPTSAAEMPGSFESSVLPVTEHVEQVEPFGEGPGWGSFTSAGEATGAPTGLRIETALSNRAPPVTEHVEQVEPFGEGPGWGSFTSAGEATGAPTGLRIETALSNRASSAVISPINLPEMSMDSNPVADPSASGLLNEPFSGEFSDLLAPPESASTNTLSLNDMLGTGTKTPKSKATSPVATSPKNTRSKASPNLPSSLSPVAAEEASASTPAVTTKSPWGTPKPPSPNEATPAAVASTASPGNPAQGTMKPAWGTAKSAATPQAVSKVPTPKAASPKAETSELPSTSAPAAPARSTKSPWGTPKPPTSKAASKVPTPNSTSPRFENSELPPSSAPVAPKSAWGTPKPAATPKVASKVPSPQTETSELPSTSAPAQVGSAWGAPNPAATSQAASKNVSKVPTPQASTPDVPSSPKLEVSELPSASADASAPAPAELEEHREESGPNETAADSPVGNGISSAEPTFEANGAEPAAEVKTEPAEGAPADTNGENTDTIPPETTPGAPGEGLNDEEGEEKEKEEEETAKKKKTDKKGGKTKKKKK